MKVFSIRRGRVFKYGSNVNTDVIIPARYCATSNIGEMTKHIFEDLDVDFSKQMKPGDFVVAGENFGCGSSREVAPLVIKNARVSAVIAESFARIFFRNAINIGLPIFASPEAVAGIKEGDNLALELDISKAIIKNVSTGSIYHLTPFPREIQRIIDQGGMVNYVKNLVVAGKVPPEAIKPEAIKEKRRSMTLTEKLIAHHAGRNYVEPGEIVMTNYTSLFQTDVTTWLNFEILEEMGVEQIHDPEKIALFNDHFVPAKDIESAKLAKRQREIAHKFGIKKYLEVGRSGIIHVSGHEEGWVLPGDLVLGTDSHTCTFGALSAFATGIGSTDAAAAMALGQIWLLVPPTIKIEYNGKEIPPWVSGKDIILYTIGKLGVEGARYKGIEFSGSMVPKLTMADRFTICNMGIEMGAKSAIFGIDDVSSKYVWDNFKADFPYFSADDNATYENTYSFDITSLEPQVAYPHLPSNVKPISQAVSDNIPIDQVVIGSCTNGRIEDFRIAGNILKSSESQTKINPNLRLIIIPGSPRVYQDMLKEGLAELFLQAGAVISPSTCGSCLGGHIGVLASGERAFSTTNRNFVGRMGAKDSEVYLGSPATAMATAIEGKISDPRKYI